MNYAILLLAGNSERLGNKTPKQFLRVKSKCVFCYSLDIFNSNERIDKILLVCRQEDVAFIQNEIKNKYRNIIDIIMGGSSRQESVEKALDYLTKISINDDDNIVIHDAARPLLTSAILNHLLDNLKKHDSVTTAIKANSTMVLSFNNLVINDYLNRNHIFDIQTPQGFRFGLIKSAHEMAVKNNINNSTDDTYLVRLLKKDVFLIEGSTLNFKITSYDDFVIFKSIIELGGKE